MSTIQSANDRELDKIQKQEFSSWFRKKVLLFYNLAIQSIFLFAFHNDIDIKKLEQIYYLQKLILPEPVLNYTR